MDLDLAVDPPLPPILKVHRPKFAKTARPTSETTEVGKTTKRWTATHAGMYVCMYACMYAGMYCYHYYSVYHCYIAIFCFIVSSRSHDDDHGDGGEGDDEDDGYDDE